MTGLPVKRGTETTDLGDSSLEVAAMTAVALVLVAQKRRPVIDKPVGGVLPLGIEIGEVAVGVAASPRHNGQGSEGKTF